MRKKLPSNASLVAFESAVRHGSFARAAEELSVTEGAISRQIARLEALLKCQLFERIGSRVKPNAAGTQYAYHVREILERLDRDTQYIQGMSQGSRMLGLAVLPTFSSRWLIPRLSDFRTLHPGIMLNLASRSEPFIPPGSGFDAALHYQHPAWAGMQLQPLFKETLIPVCHPVVV
ncbi:MAG: Glycine cleavage system transcriptional activator [Candidatus Erwinia impunctatus]|nr:Glycine cleavage system transcriptional activator [Culicoides impunctatus]